MKITFLGTSAAEGVPAVFCNCDNCKRARKLGGKNIRTRSQILIDGDMLFDFPMDTYMHMLMHNFDLSRVSRVLISHSHMDHCYPQEFIMRGEPFARSMTSERVKVYCNETVKKMFLSDIAREVRPNVASAIDVIALKPYERIEEDGIEIVPLPAMHTVGEDCFVYYVKRNGVGALFLNDTGILDIAVYQKLKSMGGAVDLITFDCTYGAMRHGAGRHMGLYDAVDQLELIERAGLKNDGTVVYITHFSHNVALDHDGLEAAARAYGINTAYDGCTVDIQK